MQVYSQHIHLGQDSASVRDSVLKNNSHVTELRDLEELDKSKDPRFVFNGYEIGNYRGELIILFDSTWHVKSVMWSIQKSMVKSLASAFDNVMYDIGKTYGKYRGNAAPVHDATLERSELYGKGNDIIMCMLEEISIQLIWISANNYEKFYQQRRKYEDGLTKAKAEEPAYKPEPKHNSGVFGDTIVTETGLMYIDLKQGTGAMPKKGESVVVNYTGKLSNGKTFDSNIDSNFHHTTPFTTKIGSNLVIAGWEEGILTMRVGGKRRLIVPPDLGFGAAGSPPPIPGNAILIFDIDLLSVK